MNSGFNMVQSWYNSNNAAMGLRPTTASNHNHREVTRTAMTAQRIPNSISESKRCSRCGTDKPLTEFYRDKAAKDGLRHICKPCAKAQSADWGRKNPEKKLEIQREWLATNPEKVRQYGKKHLERYHANAETGRARMRAYYASNREAYLERDRKRREGERERRAERQRAYRAANKDKCQATVQRWVERNRDKKYAHRHNRRARQNAAGGSYTADQWRELCEASRGRCLCCGEVRKLTPDHITPIALGGSSDISNIQPLCRRCNSSKGAKAIDYRLPWKWYPKEASTEAAIKFKVA